MSAEIKSEVMRNVECNGGAFKDFEIARLK